MTASFQTPNLALPDQGSIALSAALNFANASSVTLDLTQDVENGKMNFIQSVYIDNADNSTAIDLIFNGGPIPYRVRAQPYFQGWFPVSWPKGACRLTANSNSGAVINVMFANFAMPYYDSGPANGVSVVPPLTNKALAPLSLGANVSTQLVAGVANETVKLYRGMFEVDQPTVLDFQDGNGGATLFSLLLTAGGSGTFQVSGVPWFNTSSGNGLFVQASAACNLYGGYGYVQS